MQYRWRALFLSIAISGLGQAYFQKKYGMWIIYLLIALFLIINFTPLGLLLVVWSWIDAYLTGKAIDNDTHYRSLLGEINKDDDTSKDENKDKSTKKFKCEKCDATNDWDNKFCKDCGAKVV